MLAQSYQHQGFFSRNLNVNNLSVTGGLDTAGYIFDKSTQ